MTNEIKNVPELRFPEFNEKWDINIFGDVVTNKSSKYIPQKTEALIDIELDSIESNTGRLIKNYTSNNFSSQKNVFKQHQVLYSKLRPYLNKYYFPNFDGVCTLEIWTLDSKYSSTLSNEFLYYFIQTNKFKEVTNKSSGSKMPRADWNLVENMRFNITSLKEQQKISAFFSKLDQQIELEEQKLSLLEKQKKGYMQDIFSLKLRFKDNNGNDYPEWEEKKLEDLADIVRGASPRPIKDSKWFDSTSEVGWLRISDVTNQNGKIYNLEQRLSLEGQLKTRVIASPHLLLSIAASVGKPVINFVKTGVHDGFLIFLNPKFNLIFMYNWLEMFKPKWQKYGQPGSQVNLNSELVKSQIITIPNYYEQQKIGDFFRKIDELIEKQNQKIDLLKERKKGLLQKMFV